MPRPAARSAACLPFVAALAAALAVPSAALATQPSSGPPGASGNQRHLPTTDFGSADCTFVDTGRNRFFVLEPGHQIRLEGRAKQGFVEVTITVLHETRLVDGVVTRIVEELETLDGELTEISRNFHAICQETGDVYYFGEEVDLFAAGEPAGHEGSWHAGEQGAKPGVVMPGSFMLGARYAMEQAPGVAMDEGRNVRMQVTVHTPAGTFHDCVAVIETTPLEPGEHFEKLHAEGIGVVADQDDSLVLVDWSPAPGE